MTFTVTAWISYVQYGIVLTASRFVNDLFIVDALMALEMKLNILGGTGGFMLFLSMSILSLWIPLFHGSTTTTSRRWNHHKQMQYNNDTIASTTALLIIHDNTITRRLFKVYLLNRAKQMVTFWQSPWWSSAKSDGKRPNLVGNGKIAGLLSLTLNWDRAGQTQTGIVRAGARTGLAVRWGKFVVLSKVFPNLLVGGPIASLLGGTSPRPCRDFNVLSLHPTCLIEVPCIVHSKASKGTLQSALRHHALSKTQLGNGSCWLDCPWLS